jgi:hypothetical protein
MASFPSNGMIYFMMLKCTMITTIPANGIPVNQGNVASILNATPIVMNGMMYVTVLMVF